ncbi:MAG: type II secretion system F family protein [Desulfobacterales bacterium]
MEYIIAGMVIFLISVVIVELVSYAYRNSEAAKRSRIKKRLRKYVFVEGETTGTDIIKKRVFSDVPAFNSFLSHAPLFHRLDQLLAQANAKSSAGFYILLMLTLGVIGFSTVYFFSRNALLSTVAGFMLAPIPMLFLLDMKKKRILRFKKQLPDALDLIARALRAGHSFTGAMKLAVEEFDDPLGPEFEETLNEINFGVSVPSALKNLSTRFSFEELQYFVTGVTLQRETGGNLAELVETLARLIRERFVFEGKVRVLTAESRISAVVLVALPFLIAGFLWFTNPNFLKPLLTEPVGHFLIVLAIVLMTIGIIVMKRMVNVKV